MKSSIIFGQEQFSIKSSIDIKSLMSGESLNIK